MQLTFDKVKFPMFLHIKPLDDAGLQELTPTVWWDMLSQVNSYCIIQLHFMFHVIVCTYVYNWLYTRYRCSVLNKMLLLLLYKTLSDSLEKASNNKLHCVKYHTKLFNLHY